MGREQSNYSFFYHIFKKYPELNGITISELIRESVIARIEKDEEFIIIAVTIAHRSFCIYDA